MVVPVFFTDVCSANNCAFVVPVRGGEIRVYLLHHFLPDLQCLVVLTFFLLAEIQSLNL